MATTSTVNVAAKSSKSSKSPKSDEAKAARVAKFEAQKAMVDGWSAAGKAVLAAEAAEAQQPAANTPAPQPTAEPASVTAESPANAPAEEKAATPKKAKRTVLARFSDVPGLIPMKRMLKRVNTCLVRQSRRVTSHNDATITARTNLSIALEALTNATDAFLAVPASDWELAKKTAAAAATSDGHKDELVAGSSVKIRTAKATEYEDIFTPEELSGVFTVIRLSVKGGKVATKSSAGQIAWFPRGHLVPVVASSAAPATV